MSVLNMRAPSRTPTRGNVTGSIVSLCSVRALIFPDTVLVDASTAGKAPGTLAAADRDILGSAALRLE